MLLTPFGFANGAMVLNLLGWGAVILIARLGRTLRWYHIFPKDTLAIADLLSKLS